jgi:hypothetical protein
MLSPRVLAKHLTAGEIEGIKRSLPSEIRSLWEEAHSCGRERGEPELACLIRVSRSIARTRGRRDSGRASPSVRHFIEPDDRCVDSLHPLGSRRSVSTDAP